MDEVKKKSKLKRRVSLFGVTVYGVVAIQVYPEEVALQFSKGDDDIRKYLCSFQFLEVLTQEEIQLIIQNTKL